MTPDRFAALAEAYGGNIDRWPAFEQDAAFDHLVSRPEARALLVQAAQLDTMLATWTVPGPGAALAARLTGRVTQGHTRRRRFRLWLSGLGTAATLAGGLATGAAVVAVEAPPPDQVISSPYQITVLGAPLEPDEHMGPDDGS